MEQAKSLPEVYGSVDATKQNGLWKKLLAFLGPAYLVSVGYMDPGNWATDIAGGSKFGYSLLWVLLMSNLIALLLQSLSARLGIVRGLDLAQASREAYPRGVNFCLYILAEIAIAACDLAEVLGMAIGMQLLFGLPLLVGVSITVLDTFLLLTLQSYGMRKMEAFILGLVSIIGMAFLAEMIFAKPNLGEISMGLIPSIPSSEALYIAIGIIGATVMPHNLYLHSSLVQTRKISRTTKGIRSAIRFNIIDSVIALNLAFFVNAAILILAATAFYKNGLFDIAEIQDAHQFLAPMVGSTLAPVLFAIALIAAGQSSTITGTLAGQIVMEGYLSLRIQPWLRRLLTRLLAIIPAFIVILIMGESATGQLLILSQVILSMQLGFAIIPLIHFVSNKKKMGDFVIPVYVRLLAWLCAIVIVALNIKLVADELTALIQNYGQSWWVWCVVLPLVLGAAILLLYIIFVPIITKGKVRKASLHVGVQEIMTFERPIYNTIAITVDFSKTDQSAIAHALAQGHKNTTYLLIHIVETAGAILMGSEIDDRETETDMKGLKTYAERLIDKGHQVKTLLGHGNPKKVIPKILKDSDAELLVMGAHGHRMWKDLIFGTTIESVRHNVQIPVFIVR